MTHCPPIQVAQAVAVEIQSAVDAGDLSAVFTPRFSFGSEITKLESVNTDDGLVVDVMPHMSPAWSMAGQSLNRHDCRIKIGIRRRIDATEDRDGDGAIDTEAVAAYADLLYEILALFAAGRTLTTLTSAVWDPRTRPEIRLYDEEQLKQGLYVGWVHLPFVYHEGM